MKPLEFVTDPVFGCRLWAGRLSDNGRPIVWMGKMPSYAYRIAYVTEHGDVPADHVLDHLCRRILCINTAHLEPVTKAENERRKGLRYRLARKLCRNGHRLDDATRLITPEMGVLCRACHTGMPSAPGVITPKPGPPKPR